MASSSEKTVSVQKEAMLCSNEKLIKEMRSTPILYNFKLKENKEINAKENAWKKVAAAMNVSGKNTTTVLPLHCFLSLP